MLKNDGKTNRLQDPKKSTTPPVSTFFRTLWILWRHPQNRGNPKDPKKRITVIMPDPLLIPTILTKLKPLFPL